MARYPVTNAQYAAFVRATDHSPPSHWQGDHYPAGIGGHPVVHVTWRDAAAYCKWWADRLSGDQAYLWAAGQVIPAVRAAPSWIARLPSSAEWEKAARGGLTIPSPEGDVTIQNPVPRRAYPWGDNWQLSAMGAQGDEQRCNVSESDIGTTTPVGMYPGGASPCGLLDVAGNVWEWCYDWADEDKRYKVRRGGAFRYTHERARCAASDKALSLLAWPYVGFRLVLGPPIGAPALTRRLR